MQEGVGEELKCERQDIIFSLILVPITIGTPRILPHDSYIFYAIGLSAK